MDISIIIPCFNLENYIEKCLLTALSQNYPKSSYEIILVLDSCTDNTEEVARTCLSKGKVPYTIIKADVKNPNAARNIGIEIAKGEYFYFLDGDDYLINDNTLQKLMDNIKSNDSDAVYMTAFESDDKNVIDNYAAWRFFFKRSIIGDTRFPVVPINGDWKFVRMVRSKDGYKQSELEGAYYHYTYPREGSVTARFRKYHPNIYK